MVDRPRATENIARHQADLQELITITYTHQAELIQAQTTWSKQLASLQGRIADIKKAAKKNLPREHAHLIAEISIELQQLSQIVAHINQCPTLNSMIGIARNLQKEIDTQAHRKSWLSRRYPSAAAAIQGDLRQLITLANTLKKELKQIDDSIKMINGQLNALR